MATDAQSGAPNRSLERRGDLASLSGQSTRRQLVLRLTIITRMIRRVFDRRAASIGVTRSQWSMIGVVGHHPGATQRSIAEFLEMSEASAGRLIDRLCDEGLMERRERRGDRRARAVHLTEKAGPLDTQLSTLASETESKLFVGFSEDEIDQFLSYMNRLYRNASRE